MTAELVHSTRKVPKGASGTMAVQARRAIRRRRVLTAATEVFVARGYHEASMNEIARHAVSPLMPLSMRYPRSSRATPD